MTVPFAPEEARHLLHQMVRIRRLEDKAAELYSAGKIRGFLHLYNGQEAVAVGAIRALSPEDGIVATYREHGHALVRGMPADTIMAELFGKATGCAKGRGGSMHFFDAKLRFFGGNAIVACGIPLAVGLALADRMQQRNRVTACFFGDGATAEGAFFEALNLAALWQAPALFCCENNLYAMGTALVRAQAQTDLSVKAKSLGVPAEAVDGMDIVAVSQATEAAVSRIRRGEGPRFLEFRTYRFRAHSMYDPELYRSKAEVEEWKRRDPIPAFHDRLEQAGMIDPAGWDRIVAEVDAEVAKAVSFAEESPWEPYDAMAADVLAPRSA